MAAGHRLAAGALPPRAPRPRSALARPLPLLLAALALGACGAGQGTPGPDVRPIDIVMPDVAADARPDAFRRDVDPESFPPADPGPADLPPDPWDAAPPDLPPADAAPDAPPDAAPDAAPDLPPADAALDAAPADLPGDLPPDAVPADLPGDPTPDAAPACRRDGDPCNDGDDCTVNDACTGGRCAGTPFPCPDDDGLPCTSAACVRGACTASLAAGFCLVDGACWPDGQADPRDPCQACDADAAPRAWTWTCPETPCAYHTDCYPDRWCGLWFHRGARLCSAPCRGDRDCPEGQACTPLPGSAAQGYCQPAVGPGAPGTSCTEGESCASGLCTGQACTAGCTAQAGCAAGTTCAAVGGFTTRLAGACVADAGDPFLPNGAACTEDGQVLDASLCRSGHCDLVPDYGPCAPLCATDAHCGPAQECNLVLRTVQPVAASVPYDPLFASPTYDAVMGCYTRAWAGYKSPGTPCTHPSECTSNKCWGLVPGDPTMWCTTFCTADADCPPAMACKSDVVNLVSQWLLSGYGQAAQPDGHALVRVCKLR